MLSSLLDKGVMEGCLKGFHVGANGVHVNHLQFADDTLVFSTDDKSLLVNIKEMVCCFEEISGFKINLAKSRVVGVNLSEEELMTTANLWDCAAGSWPLSYLGMPLGGKANKKAFWQLVEEKVERRLVKWNSLNLSREGRLPWLSPCSRASHCVTSPCLNVQSKSFPEWRS